MGVKPRIYDLGKGGVGCFPVLWTTLVDHKVGLLGVCIQWAHNKVSSYAHCPPQKGAFLPLPNIQKNCMTWRLFSSSKTDELLSNLTTFSLSSLKLMLPIKFVQSQKHLRNTCKHCLQQLQHDYNSLIIYAKLKVVENCYTSTIYHSLDHLLS